jgi:hypothetical protein
MFELYSLIGIKFNLQVLNTVFPNYKESNCNISSGYARSAGLKQSILLRI